MSPHEELFHRLLDESSALLAAPESAGIAIPDDDLHREIIVPLLPAMLADTAIRGHWREQHATGFVARLGRHFENCDPAPRWLPADFEIHVTASYSAGADARALADTLLSEDSLRDMTAALMNQLLDALWPSLAPAPIAPRAGAEIAVAPTKVPAPIIPAEPEPVSSALVEITGTAVATSAEAEAAAEIPSARPLPSRALVRTLCRQLSASAVQRGIAAIGAMRHASAAIVARKILRQAEAAAKPSRPTSPRRLPRRASL